MASLLEQFQQEHRFIVNAAAKRGGYVTEVPDNTPKHIIERLQRSLIALVEKRSVSDAEERSYQSAAAVLASRRRPQSDPIHAQIADWNRRAASKKQARADARSLAAKYPELSLEDISRAIRLGYSEDTMLQLRSAAIAQQIRADGGAVADPTQSLRSPQYYRACAAKAKTMSECSRLHKLADEAEKKLAS